MEQDGEEMFSTTRAAKRLKVDRRTVHRLYKSGEFPNARPKTTRPGSPIQIPLSDIEDFERRRDAGAAE